MEYVRNRDDRVGEVWELEESMEQLYNRMKREVHWTQLDQYKDRKLF